MQYLVAVSHIVCTHAVGLRNVGGMLGPHPRWVRDIVDTLQTHYFPICVVVLDFITLVQMVCM